MQSRFNMFVNDFEMATERAMGVLQSRREGSASRCFLFSVSTDLSCQGQAMVKFKVTV